MRLVIGRTAWRSVVAILGMTLLIGCESDTDEAPGAAPPGAEAEPVKLPATTDSAKALDLFYQGRAKLDHLHFVEAHELFKQAVAQDPEFALAHAYLANTARTATDFFAAVSAARQHAAAASAGEQLVIRALVAASENEQDAQKQALEELVGTFPHDERSHMRLANFFSGRQQFDEAAKHYQHATSINGSFAPAYNALGYTYRALDNLDGAKSAFARYVELIPNEPNPYDSYAELLMEMGYYDQSIANYRKALQIDSHFGSSYAGISNNHSLKGESDAAIAVADEMLAAARDFAERQNALFRYVLAHLYVGSVSEAMKNTEQMYAEAEVKGDHATLGGIVEYIGDIHLDAGDAAKALEYYDRALAHRQKADINDANKAQAVRAHLYKSAIAAMVGGDVDTAASRVSDYSAAAAANGTAFEQRRIHAAEAFLAMARQEYEKSAEHFAQANQLNPLILYWSAFVHTKLGDTAEAARLAERAANRNTLSPNLPFVRSEALQLLTELQAT